MPQQVDVCSSSVGREHGLSKRFRNTQRGPLYLYSKSNIFRSGDTDSHCFQSAYDHDKDGKSANANLIALIEVGL